MPFRASAQRRAAVKEMDAAVTGNRTRAASKTRAASRTRGNKTGVASKVKASSRTRGNRTEVAKVKASNRIRAVQDSADKASRR